MTRAETAAEAASLAEACSASFFAAGTRPGLLLWRIDQKVLVSASTPGSFYEDAAYIVLLTTQAGPDALSSDIYLWLGAKTKPEDQGVASIMAVELDEMLGSGSALHREVQFHETGSFCSVFGNYLEYLPGRGQPGSTGVSLLSVVGDQLVSRTSTLPPTATSVSSSGVFVLDQGSRLLLWAGPESTDKARARGMAVCMTRRQRRGSTVAEVVLADQPGVGADAEFWEALGGRPRLLTPAAAIPHLLAAGAPPLQLWRLSEVGGALGHKKLQVVEARPTSPDLG